MRRNVLHFAFAYLKHWLLKEDRYSQQSPFIFSIYQGALDCLTKETPPSKAEKVALLVTYFCQLTAANQVLELGKGNETSAKYFNQISNKKVYRIPSTESIIQGIEAIPLANLELQTLDFVLIHSQFNQSDLQEFFSHVLPRIHPQGILFLEDIHQNKVMNTSWKKIKADTRIRLTLDFFDFGVAFLSYSGPKTNLILSY